MNIKVLGTGCRKCEKLEEYVKTAVQELQIDAEIEKVTAFDDIMSYGVMATPALVIDGKVAFSGKVGSLPGIKKILQEKNG